MTLLSFLLIPVLVVADVQLACVSLIGSVSLQGTNIYQSADSCRTSCGSGYPYIAFKNGNQCYCLSSFPSSQAVADQCNVPCTGFGQDMCGGASDFSIYIGDGSGSISTPQQAVAALQGGSSAGISSRFGASLTGLATKSTSSTTRSTTSTPTAAPESSPSDTATGADSLANSGVTDGSGKTTTLIKTKTSGNSSSSTSSSLSTPSSNRLHSNDNQSKSNTGAIAGGVVGGVVALALIGGLIFFLIRRRRNNDDDDDDEKDFVTDYSESPFNRSNTSKSKNISPLDMPLDNPFDHPNDHVTNSRMNSTKLTDPRLNPVMMGRKRLSEGSLADDTDYSRKILHVANPEY